MDAPPVGLRAWSEPDTWHERAADQRDEKTPWSPPESELVIIVDTETTIGHAQALLLGGYRILRLDWRDSGNANVTCLEEGLFHAECLPDARPDEFRLLREYAATHRSAANRGEPDATPELQLLNRRGFVLDVLTPSAVAGATLAAYNLPFDASRIAERWYKAQEEFYGGWGLSLADVAGKRGLRSVAKVRTQRIGPRRQRLDACVQDLASGTWWGLRVLDLHTLVGALCDENYRLDGAAEAFGLRIRKRRQPRFGRITKKLLDYLRRDVEVTADLYAAAMGEFRRHSIGRDPAQVYSPAGIAAGYLEAAGYRPVLERQSDFPRDVLAKSMAAYHGGWVECAIRLCDVPVRVFDVRSTYATIATHLHVVEYLAGPVQVERDAADWAQELIDNVTLDDILAPDRWRDLVAIVLVEPDDTLLPLRVDLDGTWTSGLYRASGAPIWVSLPDAIAAKVLSPAGTTPRILDAIRFHPDPDFEGLRSLSIRGDIHVDPRVRDLFAATVEERERLRELDLAESERKWRRQSLKTIGNAGAYGIHVRFDQHRRAKPEHVDLYTADGHDDWEGVTPESPGPWCAPFLPACITGCARLLLAAFERLVVDAGGTVAYRDTDSMFVVASDTPSLTACPEGPEQLADGRAAIQVLSTAEACAIAERFDALGISGPLWKLEDENLNDDATLRDLRFFGVRSKSYVLYERAPDGTPLVVKASEHGLGFLLDPTRSAPRPDREDPAASTRFAKDAWAHILRQHHNVPGTDSAWTRLPAVMRLPMGTPAALAGFDAWNDARPPESRVRPHGFGLSAIVARMGEPKDTDPERFRPIAPFESNPARWLGLEYHNLHQPAAGPYRAAARFEDHTPDTFHAQTIGGVLDVHARRPENKLAAPDGAPCREDTAGLLVRREFRIDPERITYLGKEAGELLGYPTAVAEDLDDRRNTYTRTDALDDNERAVLHHIGASTLAERIGANRSTIHRILTGQTKRPSAELQRQLKREAILHVRRCLRAAGSQPPTDRSA